MDEGSHGYILYWLNSGAGSRLEALVSGLWVLEFAHYALSLGSSWGMDFSSEFRELDWVLCSEIQFWDWLIDVGERVDIAMEIARIFLYPPLHHKERTGISFSLWREGSMPREHAFFFLSAPRVRFTPLIFFPSWAQHHTQAKRNSRGHGLWELSFRDIKSASSLG